MAGIVDGEGCITISRTPTFYLKMMDPQAISLVARLYDCTIARVKCIGVHRSPFVVRFTGPKAVLFFQDILPFLLVKRRQVALAIDWYSLAPNCARRAAIESEIKALKKPIYDNEDSSVG